MYFNIVRPIYLFSRSILGTTLLMLTPLQRLQCQRNLFGLLLLLLLLLLRLDGDRLRLDWELQTISIGFPSIRFPPTQKKKKRKKKRNPT